MYLEILTDEIKTANPTTANVVGIHVSTNVNSKQSSTEEEKQSRGKTT